MTVSKRALMVAAASGLSLVVCLGSATAATISVDNHIFTSLNFNDGQVSPSAFDGTLGTLTGVTFSFVGETQEQFVLNGPQIPGTYTFQNSVRPTFVTTPIPVGSTTVTVTSSSSTVVSTSANVSFSFSVPSVATSQFTTASGSVIDLDPSASQIQTAGGLLGVDESDAYLAGTLTENFTYTPAAVSAVPEPASRLLMLAGLLGFATVAALRRNKAF